MIKSKRIKWLDYAKGSTIFLVVLLHVLQFSIKSYDKNLVNIFVYILATCVMPIFFAISGFLYKPVKNFTDYIILLYKKIGSFLIPYVVFTVILNFIMQLHSISIKVILYDLHSLFNKKDLISLVVPTSYLWFIYALFIMFIFIGLIDLFKAPISLQVIIVFILLLIGSLFTYPEFTSGIVHYGQTNPITFTMSYFSCFYIGYLIKRFNFIKYLKKCKISICLVLVWILALSIQYYFNSNLNTDAFNIDDIITKLLSIFVLFSIFINCKHNKIFNYLMVYGRYTLVIYLVHIPVLFIIRGIMTKVVKLNIFDNSFGLDFIINLILSWIISIGVCHLIKHCKLIDFMFYSRKYIDEVVVKTRYGLKFLNTFKN